MFPKPQEIRPRAYYRRAREAEIAEYIGRAFEESARLVRWTLQASRNRLVDRHYCRACGDHAERYCGIVRVEKGNVIAIRLPDNGSWVNSECERQCQQGRMHYGGLMVKRRRWTT